MSIGRYIVNYAPNVRDGIKNSCRLVLPYQCTTRSNIINNKFLCKLIQYLSRLLWTFGFYMLHITNPLYIFIIIISLIFFIINKLTNKHYIMFSVPHLQMYFTFSHHRLWGKVFNFENLIWE